MSVHRIIPQTKDYLWGGERLRAYGKSSDKAVIAESWELSTHPDGEAVLEDGTPLSRFLTEKTAGARAFSCGVFPVLTKFIDAKGDLSVQVHPSDAYAKLHENSLGKSEMWYIVDALPGAGLYRGLKAGVTREKFLADVKAGTVADDLVFFPVKPGETYLIPAGTVHAIGAGVLLYEIQENSNITYRVYDWGRVGADGKPRPLHLDRALEVIDFAAEAIPVIEASDAPERLLAACPYFRVTEYHLSGKRTLGEKEAFLALSVTAGKGAVGGFSAAAGDSFLVPATEEVTVAGEMTFLTVTAGDPS